MMHNKKYVRTLVDVTFHFPKWWTLFAQLGFCWSANDCLSQLGRVVGKSYVTNLLEFFENVSSGVAAGEPVDVMHLDFQKVSKKAPHRKLIYRFRAYGIVGIK